jgi:putative nucleotidyltransferase with HDIG domain
MSHPFPLSSFKLSSEDQLLILRRLGLTQVRWSPGKSDLPLEATPMPAPTPAAAVVEENRSAEDEVRERHRRLLAEQRDALLLCERQYAEAATALRDLMDLVPREPTDARDRSSALSRALLDKMLVEGDINIRLLNEGAGDRGTAHALNVAVIAMLLGRAFGLGRDEMLDLGQGALLHDIGKMDLTARFRHRDDSFTAAEVAAYQQHVAKGVVLGQKMGVGAGPLLIIAQHHEHADGSGFPQRLNADRMSIGARIVALVNRFDGLCNPLLSAKAMTPHEALSLMFAQGRSRFDATMLNAFIRMMGVYPPGSALVVAVNSSRPLKPRVMVHDPKVPREEALVLNLEELPDLGIRRSVKPQQLPRASLDYLSPRSRIAYFFESAGPLSSPPGEMAA